MSDAVATTELEQRLRGVLERNYHHLHPFNQAMHRGGLSKEQIRGWIANRFYYQQNIPVKDALLLAKLPLEYRRVWISRIYTHDGQGDDQGGLETWLALGDAAGIEREVLLDNSDVVPGVRFAVDAYVNFVRDQPWFDGVASSLTELFAPLIMRDRTAAFLEHYTWLAPDGLQYFRNRMSQAPREADHALAIVTKHATSRALEDRAVTALEFKCNVLWALLDAITTAYGD